MYLDIKGWKWEKFLSLLYIKKKISIFFASHFLSFSGFDVSVSNGKMLPSKDVTMVQLMWKMKVPFGYFGILMPLNPQAENRVTGWSDWQQLPMENWIAATQWGTTRTVSGTQQTSMPNNKSQLKTTANKQKKKSRLMRIQTLQKSWFGLSHQDKNPNYLSFCLRTKEKLNGK